MTPLNRREVVRRLLADRGELLVVAGLGSPAFDLAAAGTSPRDFPLWGAMGGATMVGLGLALAQPNVPVLVLTGDGEMLMGIGGLATVAKERPPNLRIVVLDNERFGETGGQPTHTATGTNLAGVAKASGISDARLVTTMAEVDQLRSDLHHARASIFAAIKVGGEPEPKVLPPRDGPYLVHRIRTELLGEARAVGDGPPPDA